MGTKNSEGEAPKSWPQTAIVSPYAASFMHRTSGSGHAHHTHVIRHPLGDTDEQQHSRQLVASPSRVSESESKTPNEAERRPLTLALVSSPTDSSAGKGCQVLRARWQVSVVDNELDCKTKRHDIGTEEGNEVVSCIPHVSVDRVVDVRLGRAVSLAQAQQQKTTAMLKVS